MLHNRYRQPGGEDLSVRAEVDNLRAHGIEVIDQQFDNEVSTGWGVAGSLRLALGATWSRRSHEEISQLCEQHRPDLAHVQNFWMKLSPSVHDACHRAGVPTVQALRNFRLLCTNALFLRQARVCEDCLGKLPWRGVVRRCYRDSAVASAAVSQMIWFNRRRGTWERDVDAFIASTEHSRSKFIAGRLPAGRIFVKPNFLDDPGEPNRPPSSSDCILYVGRLSQEKGLGLLLEAWTLANLSNLGRLLIVGDGPERAKLERKAAELGLSPSRVRFLGQKPTEDVHELLGGARALVAPSLWFETFGRTLAEALACGRPSVVSDLGALGELIEDGRTGIKFPAGDVAALGQSLRRILSDKTLADRLGRRARREYLAKYTPARNFRMLMEIYRFAIERRGNRLPAPLQSYGPAGVAA